ncbi:DUF1272 domain-containing protein [Loktanella sp. D2R18]|uniref:DUF1272 domain-containing protein n=1 Tax=Rhodobacterales TaxID=204455 RepID=UPI000DEB1560|nr:MULTISPECIES: DUF1272 domain-containing protein [Rhodobacterales]MDO6588882.1 DUF1272 domain-containing protein [Yoonia sp. 1_MG-2023]RBW41895.1 DUF1272 domain-containing protein [Loktanella sp. D2R18]
MLELRPNCEWCDKDLPPESTEARICSYECTYCAECVENILHYVCATCGGGFVNRPIRPQQAYRNELKLGLSHQPASSQRKQSQWSREQVDELSLRLRDTLPQER